MEEIWKDIKEYEGFYQVSNKGNVRSVTRIVRKWDGKKIHKGRILKGSMSNGGYVTVILSKRNHKKGFHVHQLVARHFLEMRDGVESIDHINGNPSDNRVDNLRWATQKENMNNPITLERVRKSCIGKTFSKNAIEGFFKAICKPVAMIDKLSGRIIKKFKSASDAYRATGINSQNICMVCRGKRYTAGGYKWKFIKK